MQRVEVHPDRLCRIGEPRDTFYLVVDESAADDFALIGDGGYRSYEVITVGSPQMVDRLLETVLKENADILVVSRTGVARPRRLPDAEKSRRLTVLPCDTTPTTAQDLDFLLAYLARCASRDLDEMKGRLVSGIEAGGELRVVCGPAAEAMLPLEACELSETSYFRALTLTASDITRSLPLTGRISVRGRPILRSTDLAASGAEQRRQYESLLALAAGSVVLDVTDGVIGEVAPAEPGAEQAAMVLTELFAARPALRRITRLGIGLDVGAQELPGNHEVNTAVGGTMGRVFVVLDDLAPDTFELILPSPAADLIAADGTVLAGSAGQSRTAGPRRRLKRTKSPSCGCH